MMTVYKAGAALGAALLLAACGGGGSNGGTNPPGPPVDLQITAGDAQNWYYNNPLPTPLSVKAVDVHGAAVPGVTVTWAVASGGGAVTPTQSITNSSGVATAADSIGSSGSSTTQTVGATFTGLANPVLFSEHATTPPPSADVSLKNTAFNPNSVVVQTGGTVTWTWDDSPTVHNVNFAGTDPTPHPANSTTQATGTETFTFTTVGTYHFNCNIHAGMTGTLAVVH